MAVPSSGPISILGLAREKVYDDYNSASTPTGPYALSDLVFGTEAYSGVLFDETNTNSTSYPNAIAPHQMSEWYGYDHDTVAEVTMTLYLDNFITTATNYLQVYVNGNLYQVTNGNTTSYDITVTGGSSISFTAYAEDTTSGNTLYLSMYDIPSLNEYDEGTTPSLNFSYSAPSNDFEIYAETAEI